MLCLQLFIIMLITIISIDVLMKCIVKFLQNELARVIIMLLTNKELEIMSVLWKSKDPLSGNEIISASSKKTWKEKSIHIIIKSLLEKGVIRVAGQKPSATNVAKTYEPTVTSEEYAVSLSSELILDNAAFLSAFLREKNLDKEKTKFLLKQVFKKTEGHDR